MLYLDRSCQEWGAGIRTFDGLEVKLLAIRKQVATWEGILKAGGKYNALEKSLAVSNWAHKTV